MVAEAEAVAAEAAERDADESLWRRLLDSKGRFEIPAVMGGGYVRLRRELTFGQALELEKLADDDFAAHCNRLAQYQVIELQQGDEPARALEGMDELPEMLGGWLFRQMRLYRAAVAWEVMEAGKDDAASSGSSTP